MSVKEQAESRQRAGRCQQQLFSQRGFFAREEQGWVAEQGWLHRRHETVQGTCWQRLLSDLEV